MQCRQERSSTAALTNTLSGRRLTKSERLLSACRSLKQHPHAHTSERPQRPYSTSLLRLNVQSRLHSEQHYNHACFIAHDYMKVSVG
jgi:hypothetical protein